MTEEKKEKKEAPKKDQNGYVGKGHFFTAELKGRRFDEFNMPGIGLVRIRSLNDQEYAEIQSLSIRIIGFRNEPQRNHNRNNSDRYIDHKYQLPADNLQYPSTYKKSGDTEGAGISGP